MKTEIIIITMSLLSLFGCGCNKIRRKTPDNKKTPDNEIRIHYTNEIATPIQHYYYFQPEDLLEDLGTRTTYSNHKKDMCGGYSELYRRLRAIKPGVVTIWFEEVEVSDDIEPSDLPNLFPPLGIYLIDENLKVTFLKEETEQARKDFYETSERSY